MCLRAFGVLIALSALPAGATSGQDGINITVSKVPATPNISLSWAGGIAPYSIFRSTTPVDVTTQLSYLGTSSGGSYVDNNPPPGGIHYYYVEGQCDFDPPEVCDGIDNDCDPATPDGSQDPLVGAACDGADGDACLEGTRSCAAGSLACSDATGTSSEVCFGNGVDENCNGTVDEGFVVGTNPVCDSYAYLGALQGDVGLGSLSATGYSERWFRVQLSESDMAGEKPLTLAVSLYSPPGSDFDLFVRCQACAGETGGWSYIRSMTGHVDTTVIRRNDNVGRIDTFGVLIEIRNYASSYCGMWQLVVQGNTGAPRETCKEQQ